MKNVGIAWLIISSGVSFIGGIGLLISAIDDDFIDGKGFKVMQRLFFGGIIAAAISSFIAFV